MITGGCICGQLLSPVTLKFAAAAEPPAIDLSERKYARSFFLNFCQRVDVRVDRQEISMNITRPICLCVAALGICSSALFAQESANPFTNAEKGLYGYISGTVISSAEQVPESDYSFKATPEV